MSVPSQKGHSVLERGPEGLVAIQTHVTSAEFVGLSLLQASKTTWLAISVVTPNDETKKFFREGTPVAFGTQMIRTTTTAETSYFFESFLLVSSGHSPK